MFRVPGFQQAAALENVTVKKAENEMEGRVLKLRSTCHCEATWLFAACSYSGNFNGSPDE